MYPSWKGFIARIIEEERPDGCYGRWHTLFRTTFLERDLFETVCDHMLRLLQVCPEERYLVHGGYGNDNVLAQGGKVTAVLDWIDAMYGNFVYDIAWIDFWARGIDFPELFRQVYTSHGMSLAQYQERIACYKCYMGLDAMCFFAKTGDREGYRSTCRILRNLLATRSTEESKS